MHPAQHRGMALGGFAAVGEAMIELSDAQGAQWRMGFAGDTLNTAWAVRALLPEAQVDFVSAFGDDAFSGNQRAFLEQAGIGTAASPTLAGAHPGLYAITLEGAERSFTYWRSDSAARALAQDIQALRQSLLGRAVIYLTGITLAILPAKDRDTLFAVLAEARALGSRIAFDPNHRPRLWPDAQQARETYIRAYAASDIILPTFEDEIPLWGDHTAEDTATRIAAFGAGEIIVKNGADPALVWQTQPFSRAQIAPKPAHLKDTTGAGDGFCGGYLAGRMAGLPPVQAAELGHKTAALVVATHGALVPLSVLRRLSPDTAQPGLPS